VLELTLSLQENEFRALGWCREIGLAPLSPSLLASPHKLEGGSSPSFTLEIRERLRDI
jgi:hypothetical protein